MKRKKYKTVQCADGFSVSVQGNETAYSTPRNNAGPYTEVECGFPSSYDFHLNQYAEDPDDPTGTVYGWVPAHVVRMCLDSHGGMIEGELPPMCEKAWGGE